MDAACFPSLTGEAVDGTPFAAPADFAHVRTVVMTAFALESRAQVESWGPYIDALVRGRPDVRARLFAVLGTGAKIMRGVILGGLRTALAAPELRASTIVVFTDVDAFCRALGVSERKELGVFLVDGDGRIVWRGSGPYTDAAGAALTEALGG
jgi:hypothetical protein